MTTTYRLSYVTKSTVFTKTFTGKPERAEKEFRQAMDYEGVIYVGLFSLTFHANGSEELLTVKEHVRNLATLAYERGWRIPQSRIA